MNLKTQIEALLFISNKPLPIKKLAELTERSKTEVETALMVLQEEYNQASDKGIRIMINDGVVGMATDAKTAGLVEKFLKEELTGEMTRPQLETLTIVAYRGPISKMELEQIRGVNCSLILRNLLMRGLVESSVDRKLGAPMYRVTLEFVRYLGLTDIKNLPDYERLSKHETLEQMLKR
ncbi:MAG TPA: SMC-Scp complex subunit ScpB [bacterium]|nr:SMC-Scp complex subunit ScpB [bacterium]HPL95816.1 SMC-Scp complex subunit ScpB [bacterium]